MRVQFLGAVRTVTGSMHRVEANGASILLDCGLFQGRRAESRERNSHLPFDPAGLQAAILSHAHIDHSGNLPTLVKNGFRGKIYCTSATADLTDLMLRDSGGIQEENAEYANSHRRTGQPFIEPLYTEEEAARVKKYFHRVDYKKGFEPVPGISAMLFDAGHILGSASASLDVREDGREPYRLWFSGDIGRLELPLLKDPTLPKDVHYLVMESTYGDLVHPDPDEAYRMLREVVARTVKQGGKVIIPAFAVGRTQELVYNINRMITSGDIPQAPVFVDSPLAVNATEIFQEHPELFDKETYAFIREARHPALNFKGLTYIETREQSRRLNNYEPPAIIISASGMADNGRVVHHLMHHIEDPRSAVVIVGWQAPGTTGRDLVDGAKIIEIYGEPFEVRAGVTSISGFSAHAGQDLLLEYAAATRETLRKVILVHSDPEVGLAFAEKLRAQGIPDVSYPDLYETVEIP